MVSEISCPVERKACPQAAACCANQARKARSQIPSRPSESHSRHARWLSRPQECKISNPSSAVYPGPPPAKCSSVRNRLAARDPVELHRTQVSVNQFSVADFTAFGPWNRNLREVVRQIFHRAVKLPRIVLHPSEIFFGACPALITRRYSSSPRAVHDHVVDKRPLRIQQRRILRLSNGQPRAAIVHGNMLHGRQRSCPPPAEYRPYG